MKSGTPIVVLLENWQGIVLAAAVAHCAISQYWHSLGCAYAHAAAYLISYRTAMKTVM